MFLPHPDTTDQAFLGVCAHVRGTSPTTYFFPPMSAGAVSWSKNGFVCYALRGPAHNLALTYLENTNGRRWQLALLQRLCVKPLDDSAMPLVELVLWSNLLTDLAVFDENGHFYVLLAGVGLLLEEDGGNSSNGAATNTAAANGGAANGEKGNGVKGAAGSNGAVAANGPHSNGSTKAAAAGGAAASKPGDAAAKATDTPSYELTLYNHTEMIFRDRTPGRCVAFRWLGVDKAQMRPKAAARSATGEYSYDVGQHGPTHPAHPIASKQACVALRQNGLFTLYYQGEHKVEYHKLSVSLGAGVHFSHASIGFCDRRIVVAAYDALTRRVSVFVLAVDWGYLVELAARQRSDPHHHTPLNMQTLPRLSCTLVQEIRVPAGAMGGDTEHGQIGQELKQNHDAGNENQIGQSEAQFLQNSTTTDNGPNMTTLASDSEIVSSEIKLIDIIGPDVLVTYHAVNSSAATSSAIHRYRLRHIDPLHSLGPELNGIFSDSKMQFPELVLFDVLRVPGKINQITPCLDDLLVLFFRSDGAVYMLREWNAPLVRIDVGAQLSPLEPPSSVASALDCGYRVPCVTGNVALSPNMVALVHLPPDADTVSFSLFQPAPNSEAIPTEATAVAIAHAHAHACYTNSCSDDVVALATAEVLRGTHNDDLIERTVVEAHKSISFHLNSYSKESVDKLLLNPALQKLLSLQLALGELHSSNSTIRDVAWIVLNLRSTSFAIMFSLSSIYRQISRKKPANDSLEDSTVRAESIVLLVGSVKWLIDLIVYLNQELLQISLSKDNPDNSSVTVHNSVTLPLIMSKVPRLFLMYAISSIAKTHEILKKIHKDLTEANKLFTPMQEALMRFFGTCGSLPLNLNVFENFLRDCDTSTSKDLAARAAAENISPLQLEHQLFCIGKIPSPLISVAITMIDHHYAIISRDSKLSELFFYNTDWIDAGVGRSNRVSTESSPNEQFMPTQVRLQYSENEVVDALRKIIIRAPSTLRSGGVSTMGQGYVSNNKIRKCTRCRAVSLIADPLVFGTPKTISLWTMVFQRTCICGSAWVNCL